jgi:hypothetical protein
MKSRDNKRSDLGSHTLRKNQQGAGLVSSPSGKESSEIEAAYL